MRVEFLAILSKQIMTRNTNTAFIAFGSNLGERQQNILNSLALMGETGCIDVCRCSSIYPTTALGGSSGQEYLNGVVEIETTATALELLDMLKKIETKLGRTDNGRWQPRVIDLDIIFYNDQIIDLPQLKIPHEASHLRSFVLKGICELEPEKLHPVLNRSCQTLYKRLGGGNFFIDKAKPQLIEMAGTIGVGKSTLALGLAKRFDAEFLKEKYDENPYLSMVYEGRADLALKSELFFLNNSLSQLSKDSLEPSKVYIADYIFEKSAIYPKHWLNEDDYKIFSQHYNHSRKLVAEPSLVIDIIDSPANCLNRIHCRSRRYEQDIKPEFLASLVRDYEKVLKNRQLSPKITINASKYDLRDEQTVENIFNEVKHYIYWNK